MYHKDILKSINFFLMKIKTVSDMWKCSLRSEKDEELRICSGMS